jgi:L-fucose mutarotase
MLKNISPLISPELLATLHKMGHGDELVLADAHFPGHRLHDRVLRADGLQVAALLDGVLRLIEIDNYVTDPLAMMAASDGDTPDRAIENAYRAVIDRHAPKAPAIVRLERFAFYERARRAFAIVMTGERARYSNLILKKGVTPES